jgi:AcrR family transcriptional regulator
LRDLQRTFTLALVVDGGVREAKKRETRRALSSAALRLADERGLHGFTLEEVAIAAGVSARTFFNYFPSKEAAITGLDPDELIAVAEALEQRPAEEGPVDALVAVLIPEDDALSEESSAYALRMALVERHPELLPHRLAVQQQVERAMAEALARRLGSYSDDPYAVIVVAALTNALRAATEWHQRVQPAISYRETLERAASMVAEGLERPRRH